MTYDPAMDPKYKSANNIPFGFEVGDVVVKRGGDYTFRGVVVSCFRKRSGSPRLCIENEDGVVMIMNASQLEFDCPGPQRT